MISPIHKSGDKMNPENYRPISVFSCLAKLFCLVLNNRLKTYLIDNNIISSSQIGFMENHRTSDHIFTLKTLINRYVHQEPRGKIYACFVDFRKAFDSVWHNGLFHKLEKLNIMGNFLYVLKNMYSQTLCSVKIDRMMTQFFPYSKGVRQGCPLSPSLFNIYLNDLVPSLSLSNSAPLGLPNGSSISCMMYADDLILLSKSEEGLQSMLDKLQEFCESWELSINLKKTKCLTFQKKNKVRHTSTFYVQNTALENVAEYTYLGITINCNGSFRTALVDLRNKANRAFFSLNSKFQFKKLPIRICLKLFDSLLSPILLYCSEVWASFDYMDLNKWDACEIEKMHLNFCKRILGVNRSTSNILVRGELGRYPLKLAADNRFISFYRHIENMPQNSLVYQSLLMNKELPQNLSCITHLNNIEHFTSTSSVSNLSKAAMKQSLRQAYKFFWKSKIYETPKGSFLAEINKDFAYETYLNCPIRKARILTTKLRTSDHNLAIEKGRHSRPVVPREKRLCEFCNLNSVETELHFLSDCSAYSDLRVTFLSKIMKLFPSCKLLKPNNLFQYLFINKEVVQDLLSFVLTIHDKRNEININLNPTSHSI